MKRHLSLLLAAACAGTIPFGVAPACAATLAHSAVPEITAVPTADPLQTIARQVFTDLDGDGTLDTVTLFYQGAGRFSLTGVTTKKVLASVSFSSSVEKASDLPRVLYGASAIDGVKGSELIVTSTTLATGGGSTTRQLVYTWRKGKLVAEAPPASGWGKSWQLSQRDNETRGYRFFDSHHHRYVDASWLKEYSNPPRWKGTITRSVWRGGKWVKTSKRAAKPVRSLSTWGQVGFAGPRLLLSQLKANIRRDTASDLVTFYANGFQHYLITVRTAGQRTLTKGFHAVADHTYDGLPFIGAGNLDGVAGRELIFEVAPDDPTWMVLTFRSGKLVAEKAPALYGQTATSTVWPGSSDESVTNYAFNPSGGAPSVIVGDTATEEYPSGDVRFAKSVWQDGAWTKVTEWVEHGLTAEEQTDFHTGFTVPGVIDPY
jgi:hypothetical protein